MMSIEVTRGSNESNTSVLRRFTKRVQGSGLVRRTRNLRFHLRSQSELKKKKDALKRLKRRAEFERLWKLGKIKNDFHAK